MISKYLSCEVAPIEPQQNQSSVFSVQQKRNGGVACVDLENSGCFRISLGEQSDCG